MTNTCVDLSWLTSFSSLLVLDQELHSLFGNHKAAERTVCFVRTFDHLTERLDEPTAGEYLDLKPGNERAVDHDNVMKIENIRNAILNGSGKVRVCSYRTYGTSVSVFNFTNISTVFFFFFDWETVPTCFLNNHLFYSRQMANIRGWYSTANLRSWNCALSDSSFVYQLACSKHL